MNENENNGIGRAAGQLLAVGLLAVTAILVATLAVLSWKAFLWAVAL